MTDVRVITGLDPRSPSTEFWSFAKLVIAYLEELRTTGSEIVLTSRTLHMWYDLFAHYAMMKAPSMPGVVVMAGDYGFSIAGGIGAPEVDTDFGRVAVGHGTYVRPDHRGRGVSKEMRDLIRRELRRLGYDTVIGAVHLNNDLGAASLKSSPFTWFQLVGYERLRTTAESPC